MRPKIISIGAGEVKGKGIIGTMDNNPDVKPNIVHDCNVFPYPFEDNEIEGFICSHIIEHLSEPMQALKEMHRCCKSGAIIDIVTPHYSSYQSWNDLSHKFHFGQNAFSILYEGHYGQKKLFLLVRKKLQFGKGLPSLIGKLLHVISADMWEKYFAFWFPARNLSVLLEVKKQ
jgi:SAM-dependent methyltransferase